MGEPPSLEALGGWRAVLGRLASSEDLSHDQARAAMAEILEGAATPAQIAGFVVALRMKGETVEELDGLLDAMLDVAATVDVPDDVRDRLVDVVGTGGDRSHTINVSTLAALVVAGAGVPVCKHGNRAASSSCGAADLLEALGVAIELDGDGVARCVDEAGIGFCFAPRFHPAMRHAGPARRELGIPTAFNFLGPARQPRPHSPPGRRRERPDHGRAHARRAGASVGHTMCSSSTATTASTSSRRPTTSTVHELENGQIRTWVLDPRDLGLALAQPDELRGADPATNAAIARAVLGGETGAPRDVVLLNAGAALVAAGSAMAVAEGMAQAAKSIDSGNATSALERLVAVSNAAGDAAG